MKKASYILFIIGAACSFLIAFAFIVCSIVFFVFAGPNCTQMIVDGIRNGSIRSTIGGTPEEKAAIIQLVFLITAIVFIPGTLIAIASGVFSILGTKKESSVLYVLNIVFGLLCGSFFNLVAAIIGMISYQKPVQEQPNQQQF